MTEQEAITEIIMSKMKEECIEVNIDFEQRKVVCLDDIGLIIRDALKELDKEIQQYRALGTVEELKSKIEELKRWHSDHIIKEIKNEFANTSTLICHNCDHKDEYIMELEAEMDELREAREKQVPKKAVKKSFIIPNKGIDVCPSCKQPISKKEHHCKCGQAIDRSDK